MSPRARPAGLLRAAAAFLLLAPARASRPATESWTLAVDRAGRALKVGSPCDSLRRPSAAEYRLEKPEAQWYSQIGQDARLERILPNASAGFFIESGAADGELNSNSLHFEKRGWAGLLVEPDPHTFGMLAGKNRKSFAYPGALSTTGNRGTMYLRMKDCAGYSGDGECSEVASEPGPNTVAVPVTPLEELLACLGRTTVDFWSLDVEGVESSIMKHFPFDKVEVGLMLIEMNKNEENNKGIEEVMASAGFQECGRTDYDRFYANPSYFKKRGLSTPSAC